MADILRATVCNCIVPAKAHDNCAFVWSFHLGRERESILLHILLCKCDADN